MFDVARKLLFLSVLLTLPSPLVLLANPDDGLYRAHLRPLLNQNCVSCHGTTRLKGDLDLRTVEGILKGGKSGPAVVPGKPLSSPLYLHVLPGADPQMPPDEDDRLSEEEIHTIARWIERLSPSDAEGAGKKTEPAPPAEPPLPLELPVELAIDVLLQEHWIGAGVQPTELADDATFLRRLYLDLLGRIPTREEARTFLEDTDSRKRELEIDRHLGSAESARHLAEIFTVVLLGRADAGQKQARREQGWFEFLERAFRENRPWNQVVRDLVIARPESAEQRGAVRFLGERKGDAQKMAEAVAPSILGLQIQCAQCHDHPIAPEIEQRHYWGLVAFLNRSQVVQTRKGPRLAESATGGFINFKTLSGDEKPAELVFFGAPVIDEPRPAEGEKEVDSPEKYLVPPAEKGATPESEAVPRFSRRQKLFEEVIQEHPQLARAMVNRLWALIYGRGLVHPVDKMDSAHPASQPRLLDHLARSFRESGYDVGRLLRGMLRSRAYQLAAHRGPRSARTRPEHFARALEKPLPAEAYLRSLLIALEQREPEKIGSVTRAHLENVFQQKFPELFAEQFSPTLKQALFLSNNPLVGALLEPREGNLTWSLERETDPRRRVTRAFRDCLGRDPDAGELEHCVAFLEQGSGARIEHFLWALLSGPEFRLNH